MTIWAESMFYFHMAPKGYRKIFFVERSIRPDQGKGESLLGYFLRTKFHMIPSDVEFWELDRNGDKPIIVEALEEAQSEAARRWVRNGGSRVIGNRGSGLRERRVRDRSSPGGRGGPR